MSQLSPTHSLFQLNADDPREQHIPPLVQPRQVFSFICPSNYRLEHILGEKRTDFYERVLSAKRVGVTLLVNYGPCHYRQGGALQTYAHPWDMGANFDHTCNLIVSVENGRGGNIYTSIRTREVLLTPSPFSAHIFRGV